MRSSTLIKPSESSNFLISKQPNQELNAINPMEPSRSYLFVSNFLRLLLIYTFGLVISLIARIVFTFSYGNLQELQQSSIDVAEAFFMGFRTDTMSISYASLPGFLLALSVFFISASRIASYLNFTRRFFLIYFSLVYSVFLFIQIIDFYFFRFFGDHLNVMIFGLIEDDTQAIITSMWTDYPVIRILLGTGVGTIVFIVMIRKILTIQFRSFHLKPGQSIVAVLLSVVLVFTGMRNSWGTSPLRIQNTIVSDETFINKIGIGAVYSLQNAFKEKSDQSLNTDIKPTLKKYHFKSVNEALSAHLDQPTVSQSDIAPHFKARTPVQKHLEEKPPHVVVVQMESMSNHLLEFHSAEFNLMGELEGALNNSYIFRNFVSASSVTLNAVEVMLVASPETLISQSTFRERSLPSSAALPFVKAGYNTSFLTGGKLGWHNLEGYLPRQYFNEVEGDESLKENYEAALEGEWGVHDEFLFDRVYKKLENAETPQFIYAMTISNHTPFDLPETYTPYSLTVPASVDSMLKIDKELAMRNFKTYQYANDCLGKFIKRIQASPLGENTIIVAVGDHSISQLFKMSDDRLLKKLSIPFIVIVPSAYKPAHDVDVNRFGSHKDVFPTLYHLSLSNAEYIKSGNNLCSSPQDSTYFFGVYKYETGFSKDGCVHTDENLSYQWNDSNFATLKPTTPTEATKYLSLKTRAYSAAMSCYIKNELSKEQ